MAAAVTFSPAHLRQVNNQPERQQDRAVVMKRAKPGASGDDLLYIFNCSVRALCGRNVVEPEQESSDYLQREEHDDYTRRCSRPCLKAARWLINERALDVIKRSPARDPVSFRLVWFD